MRKRRFVILIFILTSHLTSVLYAQDRIVKDTILLEKTGQRSYYILVKPKSQDPSKKYPLFIFMHGRGSSVDSVLNGGRSVFTNQSCYILIPQGPTKLNEGFSWYNLKDPKQFVKDMIYSEYIIKEHLRHITRTIRNIDLSRVVLSGFSQGGRLSFCIGFTNPKLFYEIMPMGGYYMDSLLEPCIKELKGLKVTIFHGTDDRVNSFAAMKKAYLKLKRRKVDVQFNTYPLGHTYTNGVLQKAFKEIYKSGSEKKAGLKTRIRPKI